MTTAIAAPPVTAALPSSSLDQSSGSRPYPPLAPSGGVSLASGKPNNRSSKGSGSRSPPTMSEPQLRRTISEGKSPIASRTPQVPKVIVKKEPTSPDIRSSRHRPSRLNLATSNIAAAPGALSGRPSAPLTSKESGTLVMQEVGFACLSPGFNTQDPTMREQLQRSMSVRDQQRQIIEARQKGLKVPADNEPPRNPEGSLFRGSGKTPSTSKRKGPPPGLSITAPGHEQFANERVVQSAPLGQTFTGLRHNLQPLSRQLVNQPSSLSNTSHIHHVPAMQTSNRLPPIADVFPGELQQGAQSSRMFPHSPGHSSHSNNQPPLPSPGFLPQHTSHPPPQTSRPREYKSAEEAMQSMTGGREDLLPRVVHYGGHQPPTPPSPLQKAVGLGVTAQLTEPHRSGGSKRRDRDEYEKDVDSPPLGRGPVTRRGPFGEGRDSPQTNRRKKERFIELCSEAWDLFHS